MPRITHHSGLKTDSGFRLIRNFSIEHNAQRFKKHCKRYFRLIDTREAKRFRIRNRRRLRSAA